MIICKNLLVVLLFLFPLLLKAQVQVSKEPFHRPVIVNKYFRLLDVVMQPGDSSLFHIHSTPSVFIFLTNSTYRSQDVGNDWTTIDAVAGRVLYRSFATDSQVHRVTIADSVLLHVNDIELLEPFVSNTNAVYTPLPFPVLLENEKVAVYQLTAVSKKQTIKKSRGPLIAELVAGETVTFHDMQTKKVSSIKAGEHIYITPESSFYFSTTHTTPIQLIVLEIK